MGKIINSKTRFIDLLVTVLIARIPLYILPIFNINNAISNISQKLIKIKDPSRIPQIETSEWLLTGGFGILTIVCLIWAFVLMYNGYKTATNAKGIKPVILFIVAIIFAEILSKVILSII